MKFCNKFSWPLFVLLFMTLTIPPNICAQIYFSDYAPRTLKPALKIISSTRSELIIESTLNGIGMKSLESYDKNFKEIKLPNCINTSIVGKPQLPVITELLSLPDMANTTISILDSSISVYKDISIFPYQGFNNKKDELIFDKEFYQTNSFYPKCSVRLDSASKWRDIFVFPLNIYPVKYNPFTRELIVYDKLIIKISYTGGKGKYFFHKKE